MLKLKLISSTITSIKEVRNGLVNFLNVPGLLTQKKNTIMLLKYIAFTVYTILKSSGCEFI